MAFTGRAGTVDSRAGNIVAGFGTSSIHYGKVITASMAPTAFSQPVTYHVYVFTIVSVALLRAFSRARNFVTVFRTKE